MYNFPRRRKIQAVPVFRDIGSFRSYGFCFRPADCNYFFNIDTLKEAFSWKNSRFWEIFAVTCVCLLDGKHTRCVNIAE